MAFQVSPGVNVSEIDLTTVIPAVSTSIGAIAIPATWGQVETITTVTSEDELVDLFGKPNNNNYSYWLSAANFLNYSNHLRVVRTDAAGAKNATSNAGTILGNNEANTVNIKNRDEYDNGTTGTGELGGEGSSGTFFAKWPGAIGSSLKVTVIDSAEAFGNGVVHHTTGSTSNPLHTNSVFDTAPGTSAWAAAYGEAGGSDLDDELHVLVEDNGGHFSGAKGTILETYTHLSKSPQAIAENGSGNYWKDVINDSSKYIWVNTGQLFQDDIAYHVTTAAGAPTAQGTANIGSLSPAGNKTTTWGTHASVRIEAGTAYQTHNTPLQYSLNNGLDTTAAVGSSPSDAELVTSWDKFADAETTDVSLLISGPVGSTTQKHVIQQVAEKRLDAVAFVSPIQADVNPEPLDATKLTNVLGHRNDDLNVDSSYAVMDSGWKYQFDKYNNVYRWVPLNPDIAGLCARTDRTRDAWWSPAGFNRGQIKNVIKLAWNPKKAHRDDLYRAGVNPVATFPGQGTVLFGDKTLQSKPSAFDRINVRRLFIVLEKAISTSAKFSLFEFNDEFTRAQFRNMVEPFLRDVQGRRGITDFKVVCDESNNTAGVIDRNEFVGDIYVKPNRSINYIQLNFVAVRTGVDFSEIVGQF
jgi:phage tail sheath protein FI